MRKVDGRSPLEDLSESLLNEFGRAADAQEEMPHEAERMLAERGLLAPLVTPDFGGLGVSYREFGECCEEIGAACSSMRSLITVQSMVSGCLVRWGTADQRARWLPGLCTGKLIGGFCITEQQAGSDAAAIASELVPAKDGGWHLTGVKKWVTFGRKADLLLVIARAEQGMTAVLCDVSGRPLDASTIRRPHCHPLGLRGAMLADIEFDLTVPGSAVVARPGLGLSHVAQTALDIGRLSIAWGCVGMGRRCLEASTAYASQRSQFGRPIIEYQLIQRLLARMLVGVDAARALCREASAAHDEKRSDAIRRTAVAKYLASQTAAAAASDAIQVHGASGCESGSPVERMYRDSKIMQIIEGSDQIAEITISGFARHDYRARSAAQSEVREHA